MYLALLLVLWLSGLTLAGQLFSYVVGHRSQVYSNIGVRPPGIREDSVRFKGKKTRFNSLIHKTASKHRVDANLVKAIISAESNFNPWAVSPKGCMGLMQLHPDTAVRFGVQNIFDPAENIDGGVKYLRFLIQEFNGDLELVLAGYNAGEHAVARYKGIPPYRETQQYVSKVTSLYQAIGQSGSGQEASQPLVRKAHSKIATAITSAVSRVSQRLTGFKIWIIILAALILRARTRINDAVLAFGAAILIMVLG